MAGRELDRLLKDDELADLLQITTERLHKLRLRHHWPCVRLGRFEIRFTAAQVEQIVGSHTEIPAPVEVRPALPGQTALSASRRRA